MIVKFAIDESILFDEIRLIRILKSHLEHVFGGHSDTNVLRVFVNLLMNHPYDRWWLSFIYIYME